MLDLHMHSNISLDGEFAPERLAGMCGERGIHLVSLTDHNSVRGVLPFLTQAEEQKIWAVPGIELDGANLDTGGVKWLIQFPIELGCRMASLFAKKSPDALKNAEILSLMVKEPNFTPQDLKKVTMKTLVIAGQKDMIKENHTRLIHNSLPNAELAIIPGYHFIASKNPEEFHRVVEEFLMSKKPS